MKKQLQETLHFAYATFYAFDHLKLVLLTQMFLESLFLRICSSTQVGGEVVRLQFFHQFLKSFVTSNPPIWIICAVTYYYGQDKYVILSKSNRKKIQIDWTKNFENELYIYFLIDDDVKVQK